LANLFLYQAYRAAKTIFIIIHAYIFHIESQIITIPNQSQQNFQGALYVIDYLLKTVSKNRAQDMWNDIFVITKRLYSKAPKTQTIIEKLTGIIFDLKKSTPSVANRQKRCTFVA